MNIYLEELLLKILMFLLFIMIIFCLFYILCILGRGIEKTIYEYRHPCISSHFETKYRDPGISLVPIMVGNMTIMQQLQTGGYFYEEEICDLRKQNND